MQHRLEEGQHSFRDVLFVWTALLKPCYKFYEVVNSSVNVAAHYRGGHEGARPRRTSVGNSFSLTRINQISSFYRGVVPGLKRTPAYLGILLY